MNPHPSATVSLLALTRLDDLALLVVEGEDAASFLQGQTTCDVKGLTEGIITLGALCNPKGRTVAVFRLFCHGGRFHLLLRADMIESVRSRLQRYVLRARVGISDASGQWAVLGLLGPVDGVTADLFGLPVSPPVGHWERVPSGALVLSVDTDEKFLVLAPIELVAELESALSDSGFVGRTSPAEWERAEIRDGVPTVTPTTSEEFTPQMLNLDLLGGVSFTKGCYTGQEVVARTHYLGTVKRRMHRFHVCCDRLPEAGARLAGAHDENPIGQVVTVVPLNDSCYDLLAVTSADGSRGDTVRLWSSSGPEAKWMNLPYFGAGYVDQKSDR